MEKKINLSCTLQCDCFPLIVLIPLHLSKESRTMLGELKKYNPCLIFDGANGVGAMKAQLFMPYIKQSGLKMKIQLSSK